MYMYYSFVSEMGFRLNIFQLLITTVPMLVTLV